MTGTKKLYCAETAECLKILGTSIDRRSFDETGLISDYDCTKIWMRDKLFLKCLDLLTIFMTFYVVAKFGQIYNVKYLSFHLKPRLPTFMKI